MCTCRQAQDYPQCAHPPTQQQIPMTVTYPITPGKDYKHAMFVSYRLNSVGGYSH